MEEPENEADICVQQIYVTRMMDRVWVQHHVLYILLLVVQISANVP